MSYENSDYVDVAELRRFEALKIAFEKHRPNPASRDETILKSAKAYEDYLMKGVSE